MICKCRQPRAWIRIPAVTLASSMALCKSLGFSGLPIHLLTDGTSRSPPISRADERTRNGGHRAGPAPMSSQVVSITYSLPVTPRSSNHPKYKRPSCSSPLGVPAGGQHGPRAATGSFTFRAHPRTKSQCKPLRGRVMFIPVYLKPPWLTCCPGVIILLPNMHS